MWARTTRRYPGGSRWLMPLTWMNWPRFTATCTRTRSSRSPSTGPRASSRNGCAVSATRSRPGWAAPAWSACSPTGTARPCCCAPTWTGSRCLSRPACRTRAPGARRTPAATDVPVMHACGHDMHVTCLLGAAAELAAARDAWRGTLLLVFQPAEEAGKGAQAMIDDGLYERFPVPGIVLGQHVMPLPAGVLGGARRPGDGRGRRAAGRAARPGRPRVAPGDHGRPDPDGGRHRAPAAGGRVPRDGGERRPPS